MTSDDLPTSDDPVVARLRSALDELTDGAAPNETPVTPLSARRTRKWLLPAVAAAAVAVIVGVGVAATGRDDGTTPIAPTPTGPPIGAVPTIPWYDLRLDDGETSAAPSAFDADAGVGYQAWASDDYSLVLLASATETPDASATPDDWPVIEPVADVPVGAAWAFRSDLPTDRWHGIYWAPDDHTAVIVTGYGFAAADLAAILPALHVEADERGPRVVSALSSLAPIRDGLSSEMYSMAYALGADGSGEPTAAFVYVSAGGSARPLTLYGANATSITPATTPFGDGFRIEIGDAGMTQIWWQVDGGPFWAGLSATHGRVDDLLARLERVADIPAPDPLPAPDELTPTGPAPADTSTPTSAATPTTALVPASFPAAGRKPPIMVGTSVTLSAVTSLTAAGIEVVADEAGQASHTATTIEQLREADALGEVVIIETGVNGTIAVVDLARMMAAVADVDRVVVLTAHAGRPWIASSNELIRSLPERYPNVVVLDWDEIASTCGDCLTTDGIHVEDRRVYADAVMTAAALD